MDVTPLFSKMKRIIQHSYSPYSRFRVAALVFDEEGREFPGVNVENASYGLTVCAERVAVFNAITHGARRVRRVVVASETEEPVPPCGACLQVIAEHGDDDTEIVLLSLKSGVSRVYRLRDLLPVRFTGSSLGGGVDG